MIHINDISVGILAGGQATRMGNKDKGLVHVNGEPLIKNLIEKISSKTENIVVNANRNIKEYEIYNYPVVKDIYDNFQGPLAGIYSMLKFIKTDYLVTLPCDCPNFNWEVINKLIKESDKTTDISIAHNNQRSQPVFMLVSKLLTKSLFNFLENGERKIDAWYQNNNYKYIYFDEGLNYFDNINTIKQLNDYNSK